MNAAIPKPQRLKAALLRSERSNVLEFPMKAFRARDARIRRMGFPIITVELIDQLVEHLQDRSVLDVGAGSGYLSRLLKDRGVDVRAIDKKESDYANPEWFSRFTYFDVEHVDICDLAAIEEDVAILSWPDLGTSFALEAARRVQVGNRLFYCGESQGGCTGDGKFFDYLKIHFREHKELSAALNRKTTSDFGIHDRWHVFEKIK